MKPSEILKAARAKCAAGWCQRKLAEKPNGEGTFASSPAACAWCMYGAICAVTGNTDDDLSAALEGEEFLRKVTSASEPSTPYWSYIPWNDEGGRTQQEVLEAFDAAIALAEGEGQ